MLLQAFYWLRSERQLMERIEFDLLFRWFVGLGVHDPVWDHSSFSKNRDRLLAGDIAAKFLAAVLSRARVRRLLSSEHFSVDGTLIEAWASMKSFKPKNAPDSGGPSGGGRNAPADFKGEKRSNQTHRSTTDPDARLYRKGLGMEAKLCFIGHGLMENRSGLKVDARLTRVSGNAERLAALDHGSALCRSADRDHPRRQQGLRRRRFCRGAAHDECAAACGTEYQPTTLGDRQADDAAPGYVASQRIRKRIEEAFGWIKSRLSPVCARSSRPICGTATISISSNRPISRSAMMAGPSVPSVPSTPLPNSNMATASSFSAHR